MVGLVTEWVVHLLLSPMARYRICFQTKKYLLLGMIFIFILSFVGALLYAMYLYSEAVFVPIISITVVLFLFSILYIAGTTGINTVNNDLAI